MLAKIIQANCPPNGKKTLAFPNGPESNLTYNQIFFAGVCSVDFNNSDMTVAFQNIGIQCVKKKDAAASLAQREKIQVDPFKQGFKHKNAAVNLNAIRLCFQVCIPIYPCDFRGCIGLTAFPSKVCVAKT